MTKRVAIVQSNYIPWKGYFDLIRRVDEFILFDDMQYTRRDWRNRNLIKTPHGLQWLTIPVLNKDRYYQKIKETETSDTEWPRQHWRAIVHSYARAPFFKAYRERLEELYLGCQETYLSRVNYRFLRGLCDILGLTTPLTWSMDYRLVEGKTERLVDLCRQAGASLYLSGPSARGYMDESLFVDAGIRVEYMDYSRYPEYPQLYPPFDHHVSVIDLILCVGPEAPRYLSGT